MVALDQVIVDDWIMFRLFGIWLAVFFFKTASWLYFEDIFQNCIQ